MIQLVVLIAGVTAVASFLLSIAAAAHPDNSETWKPALVFLAVSLTLVALIAGLNSLR